MTELDEQLLREHLQHATDSVNVPGYLLHDARQAGLRRRHRVRSLQIGVAVATLAAVGLAVGPQLPSRGQQPITPVPNPTTTSAPSPSPSDSTLHVSGVPVPAQLQGVWSSQPITMGTVRTTEQLTLGADFYDMCVNGNGCIYGKVLLQRNLLVFYDETKCDAASVNKYQWTVHGKILDLTLTDPPDICYRAPDLDQFTWTRSG